MHAGFDLTGRNSWFVIRDEVLHFHSWILCYHEPFNEKIKRYKSMELLIDLWHLNKRAIVFNVMGSI